MKRLFLCVFTLLFAIGMKAYELTPDEALDRALKVMKNGRTLRSSGSLSEDLHLKHIEQTTKGAAIYYIYEKANGGFAIVSADSRAQSLLGYTDNGFDDMRKIPSFNDWLTNCTQALTWLSTQPEETQSEVVVRSLRNLASVEPLLGNIAWSQEYPYNMYTPQFLTENGDTVNAPTGCVATAVAQVMMYYNWPDVGVGKHTNESTVEDDEEDDEEEEEKDEKVEEQTVDFTLSHYDWANMLPNYTGNETSDDVHAIAVAKLMSDVGCALDTYYSPYASGGYAENIAITLVSHFKYDRAAKYVTRSMYDTKTWNALLCEELNNKRPIIFGAGYLSSAHAFIIDGYDSNGLYHVNWGWEGFNNGYFDINYLLSNNGAYNMNQDAVICVKPDYDNSSVAPVYLRLNERFQYNKWRNIFTYSIKNECDTTFTGSAGFILLDDKGNEIDRMEKQMIDDEIIPFGYYSELEYSLPTDIEIKDGYRVSIFYKEDIEGEDLQYNIPLNSPKYYEAKVVDGKVEWIVPSNTIPQLTLDSVEILRAYACSPACFDLTLSNDTTSNYEYNKTIRVEIVDAESGVILCSGITQVFLEPGETKKVRIECNRMNRIGLSDLTPGDYKYVVRYEMDNIYYILDDYKPITFVYNAPSELTYSNFSIDKSTIRKGDKLTTSFTVDNEGGFDPATFLFCFLKQERMRSNYFFKTECDVEANSSTQIILSGNVDLNPGTYKGVFVKLINNEAHKINSDDFTIVVEDPSSAQTNQASNTIPNGPSYNLNGQRVDSDAKGIVIINGRKILNR